MARSSLSVLPLYSFVSSVLTRALGVYFQSLLDSLYVSFIICLHWPRQRQFVYYHSQLHYNVFSFLFFSHPRVSSWLHTMQSAREKKRLGPPAGAYSLPHRRKKKIPNQYHILTCTLTLLPYMYIHFFSIFSFPTSLHFFFLLYNLVLGRRDAFYSSRRRSLGVYAVLVHLIIASVDRTFIEGCMSSCKIVGGAN